MPDPKKTDTVAAYPLQWPVGWKRTRPADITPGKFRMGKGGWVEGGGYRGATNVSIAKATERVRDELGKMGLRDHEIVISTNLALRLDGFPRGDQREPGDSGAAVYWRDGNKTRCMGIDRYARVADNLAAIAATLEAMRAIDRHGGAAILDRAFAGFTALPPPARPWYVVFDCSLNSGEAFVRDLYMRARSAAHPDKHHGDTDPFNEVQGAWSAFCAERGIKE